MSEDLTNKQPTSDSETLKLILTIVQSVDRRVTALEARFSSLEARFDRLENRLDRIEARIDSRFQKIEADIAELQKSQAETGAELRGLNKVQRDISRNQTIFNDAIRKMDRNIHDIFERLHIVEVTGNQQNSTT